MEILYNSTRSEGAKVKASEAILKGLSEDGGLFVPESIPALDKSLEELADMTYGQVAYEVMKLYLTDFTEEELKNCIAKAYDEKFDTEEFCELKNVRFICMDAMELPEVFETGEVGKIYLNFSDPWPKKRHARRRLTSTVFFAQYEKVLANEGVVEFKTDNRPLFEFSLEQVEEAGWKLLGSTFDLHHDAAMNQGNVMTEYEEKFSAQGNPIHKLIATRIY